MDPESVEAAPGPESPAQPRSCDRCGSTKISITPVPGHWLQFSCDDCDHWWWETQDGQRIQPAGT